MGDSDGMAGSNEMAGSDGMARSNRHRVSAEWTTVLVVALILLVAQLLPSPLRRHPAFSRVGPDKLLHLLGHAVLSAVLVDALDGEVVANPISVVGAVTASTGYAVAVGWLQEHVPGRIPQRADLVASLLGGGSRRRRVATSPR